MSADRPGAFEDHTRRVRPRWTWAGLGLMVLGAVLVGVGLIWWTWPWTAAGAVVLVVGAGSAVRGGLVYDNDSHSSAHGVVDAVREGGSFERPTAQATRSDPQAQADAAATTRHHHDVMAVAGPERRPTLVPIGAGLMVLVAVWLLFSQGTVYPHTAQGRWGNVWAVTAAVLLGLAAVNLATRGRSVPTSVVVAAVGAALLLSAGLLDHGGTLPTASEAVSGVLALLGVGLSLDPQPQDRADRL